MGLRDSTKNNGFKRQYKEQWVYRTVQRTICVKDSTKNNCVKDSTKNNRYKRTVQRTNKLRLKLSKNQIVFRLKTKKCQSIDRKKY